MCLCAFPLQSVFCAYSHLVCRNSNRQQSFPRWIDGGGREIARLAEKEMWSERSMCECVAHNFVVAISSYFVIVALFSHSV